MATTSQIEAKRAEVASAESALIDALWQFERARDGVRALRRRRAAGSELANAEDDLAEKKALFEAARGAERERMSELEALIAAFLPQPDPSGEGPDDEEAARLELERLEATAPIVLLPVRLETRFAGDVLKVRVYPDEIFMNAHETALTEDEQAAGRHYYDELNEKDNEKELWRDIVARFGVERSAYILRQMLPVFGAEGQSSTWWQSSITCGGTVFGGKDQQLFFPPVQTRSSSWTRPGRAVLPDRWAFVTYKDGERRVRLGRLIPEPLAMTADPKLRESGDLVPINGDYAIDDQILWTVDFPRAVAVGMGIELDGATDGFDRLIVVGVKSSISALDTSLLLERLLDAHHYTRGLAIVRQGSPTNNTDGQSTPYPPRENAGQLSYGIERQRAPLDRVFAHHCLPTHTDGHHLAMALGVPSGVMANVDRAYMQEIEHARSMNEVLWPGTFGYYLRHLLQMPQLSEADQVFTPERIADAKRYFRNHVLARGPAPAFRVGGTPYGVLPIAALRLWEARDYRFGDLPEDEEAKMATLEDALRAPLLSLFEVWKAGVSDVPLIRAGQANPDLDVAAVLSTYPSSREFRVRTGESDAATWTKHYFLGVDITPLFNALDQQSNDTFSIIGEPSWRPRLGRTVFAEQAPLYTGEVIAPVLSEDTGLGLPSFISGIGSASIQDLNSNTNVNGQPSNPNLLYAVLRHSTLMEYWRAYSELNSAPWVGFEIFGIPSFLVGPFIPPVILNPPSITSHRNALEHVAYESTAELERLFTETLDLGSHRLDAWITAFASRRLDDMRRSQVAQQLKPKGDFLGGYGWLEDLRPQARSTEPLDGVGTVETQPGNGGFIHAPSMSHASAAAVLRNGHISYKNQNPAAYAVDLSSRRVRQGRRLFEAVRSGQPVGALLGYELERALSERHRDVPGIHGLRYTLRSVYPLVANKSGLDAAEPAEAIAARNVVDGSLALRAFQSPAGIPYGTRGLPEAGTDLQRILDEELQLLAQLYDAAADLLTAESVFQLVRGNVDAAVPTLNNVTQGLQPPDAAVSRSARGGIGIAHKVALVFPSSASPELHDSWPLTLTYRAEAEPVLNAWIGQLIGDPRNVAATVTYLDAEGGVIPITDEATSEVRESVEVTLAELGLHPLDLLALAEALAQEEQGGVLDRRIARVALSDPARQPDVEASRVKVSYTVSSARSISEIMEVLNTANAVLGASRALALTDLVTPAEVDELVLGTEGEGAPTDDHAIEFQARALAARDHLSEVITALTTAISTGSGLRAALTLAASFEPLSAFPDPMLPDAEVLRPAAQAAQRELERRLAAVPTPVATSAPRGQLIAWAEQALKQIFGASFRALPALEPPRPDELGLSLDARATLLEREDAPPGSPPDDEAPDRYLQQIMRARPRLGRYRKLNLYARMARLPRPRVDIVQLPHTPGERWLGLPYLTPPEEGRAALLLSSYTSGLDPTEAWRGILLDDWTEIIPNAKEETGIALHYDSPRAQAPQAVLVATPSGAGPSWTFEELIASLEQTMDLMKIRAVDRDYLPVGQLLPASVFATNENVGNVVSTAIEPLALGIDAEGLEDG